jgi:hypothetical protein
MSSTMMMERTGMGMPGIGMPGIGTPQVGAPTAMPSTMMVPRCTFRVEKCQGGFKIHCSCEDKMAVSMVQNLCSMLQGGLCSCCCMMNGLVVCCCYMTMGMCKYEPTEDGVCITCTSGDSKCGEMIQACCDCLSTCMDAGCTCCVCLNSTPVCCGTKHGSPTKAKTK